MSLLRSELMPLFEQENIFSANKSATKTELLAVAEREGFPPVLLDILNKLPDDNTQYESWEEIFDIPEDETEYHSDDEM